MYVLGERYEYGKSVVKDEMVAYSCYKIAAEHGNADAQYKVGLFFAEGKGIYADEKQALYFWELAAKSGHAKARQELERNTEPKRVWISETAKEAVALLRSYVEKNDGDSYYRIGQFFEERKKYKWALLNYRKAGYNNSARALIKIAEFTEKGLGCDRNFSSAVNLYLRLANRGNPDAEQRLWNILRRANFRNDIEWAREAIWLGDSKRTRGAALVKRGKEWYQQNERKGAFNAFYAATYFEAPMAYFMLGQCYEFGWGTSASEELAVQCYIKAAAHGVVDAYMRMGVIKEQNAEYDKAIEFYTKAKNVGYTEAHVAICRARQKMRELISDAEEISEEIDAQRVLQQVAKPVPDSEEKLELEPEAESEPQMEIQSASAKEPVSHSFMAWMDGVYGMEKTADYTLHSGHVEGEPTIELPVYPRQDVVVKDMELQETTPWYVHVWQKIKNYFSKYRFPWFCRAK